jgi:FtsP/CotA-like multicopper oxidase with cupredoxin domain
MRILQWFSIVIISFIGLVTFANAANTKPLTLDKNPQKPLILLVKKYKIIVNHKPAEVYRIEQPDGTWGFIGEKGQYFNAIVKNTTNTPTVIHWHGLIVPNNQDGVPYITQPPIPPGGEYHYYFKLLQSGTYWMHSHYGLQIQQLLSAPLIIINPHDKSNAKNVTMFLTDFTQKKPETILHELQTPSSQSNAMPHMHMMQEDHKHSMQHMNMSDKADLTDVKYDAFLTNYQTLDSPNIVPVQPGQKIRLRVIDGAAMTNFYVNTGKLTGEAIAADGERIEPLQGSTFQLGVGQRMDILVTIPPGEGAYPILAQGEGTAMQTGLILATPHAKIPILSQTAKTTAGAMNYTQELRLKSLSPLVKKPINNTLKVNLQGNMISYVWKINDQVWPDITPLMVNQNQRVEIVFANLTGMSHPMHIHGHVFEVTKINGIPVNNGPLRDTVLVFPGTSVTVQFDANNPGNWLLHCHMIYHQAAGMMTLVDYKNYPPPDLKAIKETWSETH